MQYSWPERGLVIHLRANLASVPQPLAVHVWPWIVVARTGRIFEGAKVRGKASACAEGVGRWATITPTIHDALFHAARETAALATALDRGDAGGAERDSVLRHLIVLCEALFDAEPNEAARLAARSW